MRPHEMFVLRVRARYVFGLWKGGAERWMIKSSMTSILAYTGPKMVRVRPALICVIVVGRKIVS